MPVVHVWDGEMKSSRSPRSTLPEKWLMGDLPRIQNEVTTRVNYSECERRCYPERMRCNSSVEVSEEWVPLEHFDVNVDHSWDGAYKDERNLD